MAHAEGGRERYAWSAISRMQTNVCIERIAMSTRRKRSVVVTGASSGIG